MRLRVTGLVLALMLGPVAARAAGPIIVPTGFVEEIVAQGLDDPTGMCFLPDGRILVTEQETGRIRLIVGDHFAATDPCIQIDSVSVGFYERGLQGITVDPRWPAYPYVYVCYTQLGPREVIARFTATGDLSNPLGENLTLGSKRELIGNLRDDYANHNGGCLRFGPDGKLYVSLGEDSDPCSAQQPQLLRGCLVRLDVTRIPAGPGGAVPRAMITPPDNPIANPDSNTRLVYAYGLRNPWRFGFDRVTGDILLGDVGENLKEEIDLIRAGRNYGWPHREGDTLHVNTSCPEPGGVGSGSYEPPIASLGRETGFTAIIAAGFYRPVPGAPHNWPPEYWGDAFFGDYYRCRLRHLDRATGFANAIPVPGQPDSVDWAMHMVWAVDFTVGPDGSLWWLQAHDESFNPVSGRVRRIRYTGPTVGVANTPLAELAVTASPNPFRGSVELRLSTDPSATGLAVFDLAGRRVRELWRAGRDAPAVVRWDGADQRGQEVPAGVYVVRLERTLGGTSLRVLKLP